jgi:hypothetical protein
MDQKILLKENEEIKLIVEKNQEIIDAMTKLSNRILEDKPIGDNSKNEGKKDIENYIIESINIIG